LKCAGSLHDDLSGRIACLSRFRIL